MIRVIVVTFLVALFPARLPADDGPVGKADRADRLKAVRDEFGKARTEFGKAVRAGTVKPDAAGEYSEWNATRERLAGTARKLIDADAADAVALDAIAFIVADLRAGDAQPGLYRIALKHHAAAEKIESLLGQASAPAEFLRAVAAATPHAKIRLWANYHLAENLYAAGKPKEAEPLLEALGRDADATKLGGYTTGTLADTATRFLFEVRRLNVGQEVPDAAGPDLDGKAMKLSEYRGKVTLLVFWATWCAPCMAMVPHERALAERYAGKPFAVVGVNGDVVLPDDSKLKAAVEKNKITWRSFGEGQFGIALDWNVRTWPTIFLIDDRGVIRGKWKGDPGEKDLDAAVEKLVKAAPAAAKPPEKK